MATVPSLPALADWALPGGPAVGEPCLLVLFGASGDLTRRLLMPAVYNLACEGLLPDQFGILGVARDEMTEAEFRERLSADVRKFATRPNFDAAAWQRLESHLHYLAGDFGDSALYARLAELIAQLD